MGASQQVKTFIISRFKRNEVDNTNYIGESSPCPFCNKMFDSSTTYFQFNLHIKRCGLLFIEINQSCDLYPPSQDIYLNSLIFYYSKKYSIIKKKNEYLDFNKKIEELKNDIKNRKKNWENGGYILNLNRQNFLSESMKIFEKIDLCKEIKINFIGEVTYDAGGILREWFTTLFRALEGEKLKLFIVSESKDFSYIINPFLLHGHETFKYFIFLGKLIAKALFENITINLCFNKIIYKMILQEDISFDDLVFIDLPLYKSLKNLKDNIEYNSSSKDKKSEDEDIVKSLGLFYCIEMTDINKHIHSLELVENGRNINVTNIDNYIDKRISFLKGIYKPFIDKIREGLFYYLPQEKIINFNSDELELLLNGKPFIDVEEWKNSTEYIAPYNPGHRIIKWFWDIVFKLSQEELSHLLMFSTGTARVPIGGFALLESNRGNIAKFTIQPISYIRGKKNFIKAHTCFNRIDLPTYIYKKEIEEAIHFISENEILGFGID